MTVGSPRKSVVTNQQDVGRSELSCVLQNPMTLVTTSRHWTLVRARLICFATSHPVLISNSHYFSVYVCALQVVLSLHPVHINFLRTMTFLIMHLFPVFSCSVDSSVGIATRYGLDGPGIESQ